MEMEHATINQKQERTSIQRIVELLKKTRSGSIVENMLVMLLGLAMCMAFLTILFGAFQMINDRWNMQQIAREYLLLMETEGYLSSAEADGLISELEEFGLYDITLDGSTLSEVPYGDPVVLKINGTYDQNILQFAGGISKITEHPVRITITRKSTAKL